MEAKILVETCQADQISPERRAVLDATHQREFGWDPLTYTRPQWYVMGCIGDQLVSRVAMLERTITVGGVYLRIGGVTGVVTEPGWRRRGIASDLVRCAVRFLAKDHSLPYVLLTCQRRLGPFYEKLGWRIVDGPTVYDQPDGRRTCPGLTMIVECHGTAWPDGSIDMQGLPW